MIQIEGPASAKYGSQKALVNLLAAAPSLALNTSLAQRIAVVPFESITLAAFRSLVFARHADGLLILLPAQLEVLSPEIILAWSEVERELLHMEVGSPSSNLIISSSFLLHFSYFLISHFSFP
jgi:hypothetical protein